MPRLRATHPAAVALVVSLLVAGVAAAQGVAAPAPSPAAAPPAAAVEGAVADSAGGLPPRPDAEPDAPPAAPPPRAYGAPGEGADLPIRATRRRGLLLGVIGGLDLGSATGTPSAFDKRNDQNRVETGVSPGYAGTVFAGGAITDWFSFSLGLSRQSFATGDLTFKGTSFLFRVETYPLFPRGGIFRDLGVGLDLGTGSGKVVREGLLRAAAGGGATSVFGGNVWYEALRLSTFTVGPAIGYHHFVAETLAVNTLTVGARVAFTSGP